jgi:NADPH:quinone reductase-like Zn-dependent oxidoreductase
VVTTAGSDEKCKVLEALGADRAVNYRSTDFVEATIEASLGHGADVILDMVGGDYLKRNCAAAAPDGRIVEIATLAGPKAEIDIRPLMLKRLTLTGSTLRSRPVAFKAELARALEETVWPIIAKGQYKPVIDRVFPFTEIVEAHRRIEDGAHVGKIVLSMVE